VRYLDVWKSEVKGSFILSGFAQRVLSWGLLLGRGGLFGRGGLDS